MNERILCEIRVDYVRVVAGGTRCPAQAVAILVIMGPTLYLSGTWVCERHVQEAMRKYPRTDEYTGASWTYLPLLG